MRYLAALLLLPLLTVSTPSTPAASNEVQSQVADREPYRLSSDVRIKRMHLMRPDLISYPILQDYYA